MRDLSLKAEQDIDAKLKLEAVKALIREITWNMQEAFEMNPITWHDSGFDQCLGTIWEKFDSSQDKRFFGLSQALIGKEDSYNFVEAMRKIRLEFDEEFMLLDVAGNNIGNTFVMYGDENYANFIKKIETEVIKFLRLTIAYDDDDDDDY